MSRSGNADGGAAEPGRATTVSARPGRPSGPACQASAAPIAVETVPSPPPVEGETLGDAGVAVMLGSAQADKTLVQLAPATATPTVTAPPVAGTTDTTAESTTGTTTGRPPPQ